MMEYKNTCKILTFVIAFILIIAGPVNTYAYSGSMAVSYTHLDVYKRQIKQYTDRTDGGNSTVTVVDVRNSGGHLHQFRFESPSAEETVKDVYKRQDYTIIGIIFLSAFIGYVKGLISALFSLVGYVAAVVCAVLFSEQVALFIMKNTRIRCV